MPELNAQELKKALVECVDRIGISVEAFPWENEPAYGYWLAQTYYFVRHTTSFLTLTASRFGYRRRELQYHQIWHLREESGHDQLLINDLARLRHRFDDFEELPETASLYQSQYYFIDYENPASHFAYAQCLEGTAATKISLIYKRVETSHSPEGCTFLRVHMEEDPDHFERGLEVLDSLTSAETDSYYRNLQQTTYLYVQMLEHIKRLTL
jgi:Iron-containing redox enzyme